MIINIKLTDINITQTYEIYYMFGGIGTDILNTVPNRVRYGTEWNVDNVVMTIDHPNPFGKTLWVLLKEKNGSKYLIKNIEIDSEILYSQCITCCVFSGGSLTFNSWNYDCDVTFTTDIKPLCEFSGGSMTFHSLNINCSFSVDIVVKNRKPEINLYRDASATDMSDLITSDSSIALLPKYPQTFNGSSVDSLRWEIFSLSTNSGWYDGGLAYNDTLEYMSTGVDDYMFRVKITDTNGLVGYSNVIRKYYTQPIYTFDAYVRTEPEFTSDICKMVNTTVCCYDPTVDIGSLILRPNLAPLYGTFFIRVIDGVNDDYWFEIDQFTGRLLSKDKC